jgi:dTDP-4-amino-4,6-dideoxygalactose transaminase
MNKFLDKKGIHLSNELHKYFMDIFDRQYYTESGPLVQELERLLQAKLKKKNVVCISNASIAWLMLIDQLTPVHKVVIPQNVSKQLKEAISWLGVSCQEYDETKKLSRALNERRLINEVIVIQEIGIFKELAGIRSKTDARSDKVLMDTQYADKLLRLHSQDFELVPLGVYSFDSSDTTLGFGACIYADDDDFADALRCMRGSGGVRRKVFVKRTVNGRMSEAQAAFVLSRFKKMIDDDAVAEVSGVIGPT